MSDYTLNLGIEQPVPGQQDGTWGVTLNNNWDVVDQATNGYLEITLSVAGTGGSANALDSQLVAGVIQDGQNAFVSYTDAGGDPFAADSYVELTPNTAERLMFIQNNLSGSRSLHVYQGDYNAGAQTYIIANGKTALLAFSGEGATQVLGTRSVLDNVQIEGDISAATVTLTGNITAANLSGTNTGDNTTATTTTEGIIELATQGEVDAGTGASLAVTPVTMKASTLLPQLTTKGDLLGWSTALTRVSVGANDFVLTADSTAATGWAWKAAASGFADPMTTAGDFIYKNSGGTTTRLPIGANGYVITSDGTNASWQPSTAATVFTSLTDVPSSYAGSAGYTVRVNGTATELEFVNITAVTAVNPTSPITSTGGTTPTIGINSASTSARGSVELATTAETNTGTDTIRAVTPAGLTGWNGSANITTLGTITAGAWTGTTIAVANGGTGVTTKTGTGSVVLSASPTFTGTLNAAAITATGVITGLSFAASSDRRLKTDLKELEHGISILDTTAYSYYMKHDPLKTKQIGYMADDVAKLFPEVCTFDKEGHAISVDYGRLIVPAIETIKDLHKRIQRLERLIEGRL